MNGLAFVNPFFHIDHNRSQGKYAPDLTPFILQEHIIKWGLKTTK